MAGRFLNFFGAFIRLTPEIKQPDREISFRDKMIWTFVVLIVFLVMSNIPIYGIKIEESTDYFYWLRVILASQRGTLTELGIGPIVTAGLIMQLLQGAKLIEMNMNDPHDRSLFTGSQKVMGIFLTIFQIIAYIYGGAFGSPEQIATVDKILIFVQLLFAGIIIILLDEILQKGWGLGSGISLFIAAGVAGQIFWNSFSNVPIQTEKADGLSRGIIVAFFQVLFNPEIKHAHTEKTMTVWDLFIRDAGAPDFLGLLTTILIFLVAIYIETMRVEIPLQYTQYRGFKGKYPMKLLYVSNIPVILAQALYANFLFFGQIIAGPTASTRINNPEWKAWLDLIGTFEQTEGTSYLKPTGGIIYYLTPPQGLSMLIKGEVEGNPWVHGIVYLIIFLFLCIKLGQVWVEVSGLGPQEIAGQIVDSKMQIKGFRKSDSVIEKILEQYIPTLTILCGGIIALLSFGADFLGALSSGTGLLLMVGIIQNYAETISKEAAAEQYPAMRALLGLE